MRELHPLGQFLMSSTKRDAKKKAPPRPKPRIAETTDKRPFLQCSAESNVTCPATTVMRIASALKSLLGTLYGSAEITVKSA